MAEENSNAINIHEVDKKVRSLAFIVIKLYNNSKDSLEKLENSKLNNDMEELGKIAFELQENVIAFREAIIKKTGEIDYEVVKVIDEIKANHNKIDPD